MTAEPSPAEARLRELEEAALAQPNVVMSHDALEVFYDSGTVNYGLHDGKDRRAFGIVVRSVRSWTRAEALVWLARRLAYNARLKAQMAPVVAVADAMEIDDVHARAVFEANRRRG